MKFLTTFLIFDLILGAAMVLYVVVIWHKNEAAIKEHGWDLNCADPLCNNMWLVCFIPVIGIIYYLIVGETMGKLASTNKEGNCSEPLLIAGQSQHFRQKQRSMLRMR